MKKSMNKLELPSQIVLTKLYSQLNIGEKDDDDYKKLYKSISCIDQINKNYEDIGNN